LTIESPDGLRVTLLLIVFLSVDATAGAILAAVQVPALAPRHFAVGLGGSLFGAGHALLPAETVGFSPSQFATAHTMTDAPLLTMLALVNARRVLRRGGNAQAKRENGDQYHTNDLPHAILLNGLK
jgi:hypothetical protein